METTIKITAEDLLVGAAASYTLTIPPAVLRPGLEDHSTEVQGTEQVEVEIRPLTIKTFQLITRAAKDDPGMIPILMIKEGVVTPQLNPNQIAGMHIGLVEFLVEHIRRISGLSQKKKYLEELAQTPLAKAGYVLAKQFGWSPQQMQEMTMAQIAVYVKMAQEDQ